MVVRKHWEQVVHCHVRMEPSHLSGRGGTLELCFVSHRAWLAKQRMHWMHGWKCDSEALLSHAWWKAKCRSHKQSLEQNIAMCKALSSPAEQRFKWFAPASLHHTTHQPSNWSYITCTSVLSKSSTNLVVPRLEVCQSSLNQDLDQGSFQQPAMMQQPTKIRKWSTN